MAEVKTPAGAVAFVRYFNDEYNRALSLPDASRIPPLCLPSATICQTFQKDAETLVEQRQHLDRPALVIQSLKDAGTGTEGDIRVELRGYQDAFTILDARGATVTQSPKAEASFVYYVAWVNGDWKIQDIVEGTK